MAMGEVFVDLMVIMWFLREEATVRSGLIEIC